MKERFIKEGWMEMPPQKPSVPPKFTRTKSVHEKALRLCEDLNRRPKHLTHMSGRPSAWGDMLHYENTPVARKSVTQGGRRRQQD